MAEYIDRESIYKTLAMENPFGWNNDDLAELFRQAKPVDVAPVVQGRWVEKEKYTFGIMYDCSLCGNRILDNGHTWNYCPNCGTKMAGERKD